MTDHPGATAYHLRPVSGWLNDPNGMIVHEGRWHVFFQHNPHEARHDRIAWGHASSSDLVTWTDHPVAFGPTPQGPDHHGCWSGVVVVDEEGPAALYSGIATDDGTSTVCLRRGDADLLTWGPPTVVAPTPDVDGVSVMRDPFVFHHGGRRFALLGAGLEDGTPAVLLFSCDDLLAWEYRGVWLSGADPVLSRALPADVWECPQLAVRDGRAALVLSLHDAGVLGQVVACAGEVVDDGGLPRFVPQEVGVLDTGTDFYAPQLAVDEDEGGGWWLMGWVRDEHPDLTATDHAGCLTLPRRLLLGDEGSGHAGDVPRLVLDPAFPRALVTGDPAPARGPLSGRWQVDVGPAGAVLRHGALGSRTMVAGTTLFVDGPVLEIYPPGEAPATFRHREPWAIEGEAVAQEVLTSSRAAGA